MEISDSCSVIGKYAYINAMPPKNSLAGEWYVQGNHPVLFILNYPQGAIVDVCLDYVLADDVTTLITIGSGVINKTYYLYLDHSSVKQLVPVGLVSTT